MKLTFIGAGAAFTVGSGNWQSNMLIESDSGKKLLIDCGSDVRHALAEIGVGVGEIDAVYISHQHADHVGGLEWLGFCTYFNPTLKRPKLFANGKLLESLWDTSLKGGMGSIQGKIASLNTYFDVKPVEKNGTFEWEGIEFQLVQVVHYMDGFDIVPSYGLLFKTPNAGTVFVTTDTQFNPNQIRDFYAMSDVIFQDCETSPFKSGVHAHYTELKTLDEETKEKMWLYHYQDGELPACEDDGFLGFVKKGQTFEL